MLDRYIDGKKHSYFHSLFTQNFESFDFILLDTPKTVELMATGVVLVVKSVITGAALGTHKWATMKTITILIVMVKA